MRTIPAAAFLSVVLALLTGCTGPRPLHVVRSTADRAFSLERWEEAATNYEEFIERKPSEPEVRYRLGRSYIGMGNPKAAREHMRIACDVVPNNDQYIDGYAAALLGSDERDQLLNFLRTKANDRGKVSDFIRLGEYAAKVGHADEAIASLKTAARIDGGMTLPPQLALANFYGSIGEKDRQLERLRMAYFIAPGNPLVNDGIRAAGEIPGPTFALVPVERDPAAAENR